MDWPRSCITPLDILSGGFAMIRRIAPIVFIFFCTTIAWVILGSTIYTRTGSSNEHLEGRVASTWGTVQEQSPPTASYKTTGVSGVTFQEDGRTVIRQENVERMIPLPLDSSRVDVNLQLDHRQKGLLWYSTYIVDFKGVYGFRNNSAEIRTIQFGLPFPAEHAIYDGLVMEVDGHSLPVATSGNGGFVS